MSAALGASFDVFSRTTLSVTFAIAALSKLRTRSAWRLFRDGLRQFDVWPQARSAAAIAVVGAECLAVLGLALVNDPAPYYCALSLLLILTGFLARARSKRADVACYCFGWSTTRVGPIHFTVNAVLCADALAAALVAPSEYVGESAGSLLLAIGAGAGSGVLAASIETIQSALTIKGTKT